MWYVMHCGGSWCFVRRGVPHAFWLQSCSRQLWRLARACNYLVDESLNPDEKKALAFEGLAYAEKAYSADSNSAAANKWMGIMTRWADERAVVVKNE